VADLGRGTPGDNQAAFVISTGGCWLSLR